MADVPDWRTSWQGYLRFDRAGATASWTAFKDWVVRAADNFSAINGTVWSASFAYYAFFALVPLLLLLVTLATDVMARAQSEEAAQAAAFRYVVENIPLGVEGRRIVAATLQGVLDSRGKIGLVSVLGLLWSSLGFFQSLVCAVNQAWGQDPLNWWKLPLQNLKMVGVLLSALLLGNVLPVVVRTFDNYHNFGAAWISPLLTVLLALVPSIVLFCGFLLFYRIAPRRASRATFQIVWIPALLVTLLLQISQRLFGLYTTNFTNFNAVYGAFGGIIALMLWIYLSGVIIVFGGCLCAARRKQEAPVLHAEDGTPQAGLAAPH